MANVFKKKVVMGQSKWFLQGKTNRGFEHTPQLINKKDE
jgi:hypothetical protein